MSHVAKYVLCRISAVRRLFFFSYLNILFCGFRLIGVIKPTDSDFLRAGARFPHLVDSSDERTIDGISR